MLSLGMKTSNMILIEKLQKYRHYHQAKFININILQEILSLFKLE